MVEISSRTSSMCISISQNVSVMECVKLLAEHTFLSWVFFGKVTVFVEFCKSSKQKPKQTTHYPLTAITQSTIYI